METVGLTLRVDFGGDRLLGPENPPAGSDREDRIDLAGGTRTWNVLSEGMVPR
jgi:hypothetical protein